MNDFSITSDDICDNNDEFCIRNGAFCIEISPVPEGEDLEPVPLQHHVLADKQ